MPSASLGPIDPEEAVDTIANLAKPLAEPQEPIPSSSAVPLTSEEVHFSTFLLIQHAYVLTRFCLPGL